MSANGRQLALAGLEPPEPEPEPEPVAEVAAQATPATPESFEPTAEQATAIASRERDAFLEAGAGSGKTTVLVDRYCAAIVEDGVEVDRILAFTFTERAAAEMRTRIRRELVARSQAVRERGDEPHADELLQAARATERAWVMTIHAFCRRLLGSHPLAAGLDPRFRVLDAPEAGRLADRAANEALDELLAAGDANVARAAAAYQPWRITQMTTGAHARLRSQGMSEPRLPPVGDPAHSPGSREEQRELTPAELEAAASARAALERLLEGFDRRYAALKEQRSALDFQDLELGALELLRASPALAGAWRERFTHVMVDEFQDTNSVQLELIERLCGPETRLLLVGDENQSIYRFRNAELEVFRGERARARDAADRDLLPLLGNFRSLPAVLAAVNEVGRTLLDGFAELTSGREAKGRPGEVELLLTLDEGRGKEARKWAQEEIDLEPPPGGSAPRIVAEARFLAERLRQLVEAGEAERGEIVVLLRAFTHVDAYEEALRRAGLRPFVVGGRGYWTQQQVEDLVRLLGVVSNPLDDEYLFGALACFANAVSPDALWLLRHAASDDSDRARPVWPLIEWRFGDREDPPADHRDEWLEQIPEVDAERLRRFCALLAQLRAEAPLLTLEQLIERTMTAFGYDLGLIARDGGAGRMANVRKLMRLARDYETNEGRDLAGFLALAAESTRRDEREGMAAVQAEGHDGVRVMTVHAAKGLEFPVVAVPDLGRKLNAGHQHADLVIGPPSNNGERGFGMRLVFPSAGSLGLWELVDLNTAESEAEAEEGCRLVYVAASRAENRLILSGLYAPADLDPAEQQKPNDTPLRRLLPALAERGFAGEDTEIEIPGPLAVDGSTRLPDAGLRIRVSEPGAKRAAELVRSFPAPAEDDPLAAASGSPPLLDPNPGPVPIGHLSYSALSQYEGCGYRFYVERVLGAREALAASDDDAAEEPPDPPTELVEPGVDRGLALGIGNAVHAALEWSARHGWEQPSGERFGELLAREGLAGQTEALARAQRLVGGWLESDLRASLAAAPARAEVPFVLDLGSTVARGQIDLLVADGDGVPTVIDYKTDALDGRTAEDLGARYEVQRQVYALAAGGGSGARTVHVFLEAPGDPVIEEFDPERLAAARESLEAMVERMRDGVFEVTEEPFPALCFGCPAAARLCPRPKWKPSA
ncbi:MAG TPA: UvrD-helicase domain-containing protein [Solirubrobacterales bacterium]|jgi:ATP-dependent exoDNAse (exonuclease V) beta subunit